MKQWMTYNGNQKIVTYTLPLEHSGVLSMAGLSGYNTNTPVTTGIASLEDKIQIISSSTGRQYMIFLCRA